LVTDRAVYPVVGAAALSLILLTRCTFRLRREACDCVSTLADFARRQNASLLDCRIDVERFSSSQSFWVLGSYEGYSQQVPNPVAARNPEHTVRILGFIKVIVGEPSFINQRRQRPTAENHLILTDASGSITDVRVQRANVSLTPARPDGSTMNIASRLVGSDLFTASESGDGVWQMTRSLDAKSVQASGSLDVRIDSTDDFGVLVVAERGVNVPVQSWAPRKSLVFSDLRKVELVGASIWNSHNRLEPASCRLQGTVFQSSGSRECLQRMVSYHPPSVDIYAADNV
jgi:hypothetical protein